MIVFILTIFHVLLKDIFTFMNMYARMWCPKPTMYSLGASQCFQLKRLFLFKKPEIPADTKGATSISHTS